jgi:hypothetical protein
MASWCTNDREDNGIGGNRREEEAQIAFQLKEQKEELEAERLAEVEAIRQERLDAYQKSATDKIGGI